MVGFRSLLGKKKSISLVFVFKNSDKVKKKHFKRNKKSSLFLEDGGYHFVKPYLKDKKKEVFFFLKNKQTKREVLLSLEKNKKKFFIFLEKGTKKTVLTCDILVQRTKPQLLGYNSLCVELLE